MPLGDVFSNIGNFLGFGGDEGKEEASAPQTFVEPEVSEGNAFTNLVDNVGGAIDNTVEAAAEKAGDISSAINQGIETFGTTTKKTGDNVLDFGRKVVDSGVDTVTNSAKDFASGFTAIPRGVASIGRATVREFNEARVGVNNFIERERFYQDVYNQVDPDSGSLSTLEKGATAGLLTPGLNLITGIPSAGILGVAGYKRRKAGRDNATLVNDSIRNGTGYKGFLEEGGSTDISELEYNELTKRNLSSITRKIIKDVEGEKKDDEVREIHDINDNVLEDIFTGYDKLAPNFLRDNQHSIRTLEVQKQSLSSQARRFDEIKVGMARNIEDMRGNAGFTDSLNQLASVKTLSDHSLKTTAELSLVKANGVNMKSYLRDKLVEQGRWSPEMGALGVNGLTNIYTKTAQDYANYGLLTANMSDLDLMRIYQSVVTSHRGVDQLLGSNGVGTKLVGVVNALTPVGAALQGGLEQVANKAFQPGGWVIEGLFGDTVGDITGAITGNNRSLTTTQNLERIKDKKGNFNVLNRALLFGAENIPDATAFITSLFVGGIKNPKQVTTISTNSIGTKLGLSVKNARRLSSGFNKTKIFGRFTANEIRIESQFNTLDPDAGSKFSENMIKFGFGLGVMFEYAGAAFQGLRRLGKADGTRDQVLNALHRGEVEAGELGIGKSVAEYNEAQVDDLVNTYSELKKLIGEEEYNKLDTELTRAVRDQAKGDLIVRDLIDQGIVDSVLLKRATDLGDETAIKEIQERIRTTSLTPDTQKLVQAIDETGTNLFDAIEKLTGVPYAKYISNNVTAQVSTPSYIMTRQLQKIFPETKPITSETRYSADDLKSIRKKARVEDHPIKDTNRYFEQVGDGFYLKVEEFGEEMGLQKINYSTADLGRLNKDQQSFVNALEQVNQQKGERVFDTGAIVNSNLYNNLNEFLSDVFCK